MTTDVLPAHIVATPDVCGGKPRIAGHRITVQNVAYWHERDGKSVDEIATEYDLTLGDIYAALSYYSDRRDEVDRRANEDRAWVDGLRNGTELT
jgi:uncharacterized protein (DUF433 family)